MRAVIYTGAGGPEVISLGEVPNPEVQPGHIRVRVRAAGLNRADLLQRRGGYPAPKGWPANIPGLEYAGEVEAVRGGPDGRWATGSWGSLVEEHRPSWSWCMRTRRCRSRPGSRTPRPRRFPRHSSRRTTHW